MDQFSVQPDAAPSYPVITDNFVEFDNALAGLYHALDHPIERAAVKQF